MGDHGVKKLLEIIKRPGIRVLTICNTGSLATAGFGTALGVVRALHSLGKLEHVYACETRPYNQVVLIFMRCIFFLSDSFFLENIVIYSISTIQGARLTAFEIVEDSLPGTLISDSMAAALMSVKGVDCVLVGADRVAANGDTANKIGTYQLAIVAQYHKVPFFVVSPSTTLDVSMSNGSSIHVEERPAIEMTT